MKDFQEGKVQEVLNGFFLLSLNSERKITFINTRLASFFRGVSLIDASNFLSLFPESEQLTWENIFLQLRDGDMNFKDAIIPFKESNATTSIYWRINKLTDDGKGFAGFEIAGTVLEETIEDRAARAMQIINKPQLKESDSLDDLYKLQLKVKKLSKLLNSSLDIICAFSETGKFIKVSAACRDILGYEPAELVGTRFIDYVYREDVKKTMSVSDAIRAGCGTTNFSNRYVKKDGSVVYLSWSSRWDEADKRYYSIARDVTELQLHEEALKQSEEKYRILFYSHPLPMFIYDARTFALLEANKAAVRQYGYSSDELLQMQIRDLLGAGEVLKFDDLHSQKDYYLQDHRGVWMHRKKSGELFYAEITSHYIGHEGRKSKLVMAKDCTSEIIAEKELLKTKEKYLFLTEATFDSIYDWDLRTNEVQWNDAVKTIFGVTEESGINNLDWWLNNLHPEDRDRVEAGINNHLWNKIANWEDEYRFRRSDNTYKYIYDRAYIIYDENNKPIRMIGVMQDLTERKENENVLRRLNNSLEKRAKELAESNAELERFAYVASHDLQEPLRMVTSFLQLLEKRYKDKLDQKAKEYITFAVDGAERMKRLILDLLEYSRVNSSKIEKEDIDVNEIINDVKLTYKSLLRETGGKISSTDLPVIKGNKTQILQLFQNLIGNAFKYRSEAPPEVNISYEEETLNYKFLITDNGIGIDPKFFNKIFIIFQRLHNREQYSGTGIGLAICKKIIDKHGGKIWLNSALGQGSTFYFTIPKSK